MKNGVEFFVTELVVPVERRQILRHEIAAVTREILEITRTKIIYYGATRIREFFLQRKREIGPDETGTAGDEQV